MINLLTRRLPLFIYLFIYLFFYLHKPVAVPPTATSSIKHGGVSSSISVQAHTLAWNRQTPEFTKYLAIFSEWQPANGCFSRSFSFSCTDPSQAHSLYGRLHLFASFVFSPSLRGSLELVHSEMYSNELFSNTSQAFCLWGSVLCGSNLNFSQARCVCEFGFTAPIALPEVCRM